VETAERDKSRFPKHTLRSPTRGRKAVPSSATRRPLWSGSGDRESQTRRTLAPGAVEQRSMEGVGRTYRGALRSCPTHQETPSMPRTHRMTPK
jgi:hypothetical protein